MTLARVPTSLNAEQEIVRLKGSVAIQRTRRERAEAVAEDLASWVVKLSDLLRGEFCLCLTAWFCELL